MPWEIPEDLRRMLAGDTPVEVVDPATSARYVVLEKAQFDRIAALLADDPLSEDEQRSLLHHAGRRAGWDDPAMDVYNDLDPRRRP